jgi:hypothetical protein
MPNKKGRYFFLIERIIQNTANSRNESPANSPRERAFCVVEICKRQFIFLHETLIQQRISSAKHVSFVFYPPGKNGLYGIRR